MFENVDEKKNHIITRHTRYISAGFRNVEALGPIFQLHISDIRKITSAFDLQI